MTVEITAMNAKAIVRLVPTLFVVVVGGYEGHFAYGQDALATQPKFEQLLQGIESANIEAALDAMATELPVGQTEAILSRLPYGRMVHIDVPALPDFAPLKPDDDPRIVLREELPSADLERIIGPSDLLPAHFLSVGVIRQAPVARIRLKSPHATPFGVLPAGSGWGTAFLISEDLLLTNNHVIANEAFASTKSKVQFNFQIDLEGAPLQVDEYDLDPDAGFYTNPRLDFTVVRVKSKSPSDVHPESHAVAPGTHWGFIELSESVVFAEGQPVNVIQHPAGRYKEVALQKNEITDISNTVIRYRTDTEPGSSGSPVFDNHWELVALHHSAGERSAEGVWLSNEGIRIDRIIDDIRSNAAELASELDL
ncbi:MAG: serine protease [Planctomycetota bacterium]|nr:MAG: serine protease [Planctomycetota bacterium]REK29981.1 MAG: serine protease [Planctomycetota bacterium]